MHKNKLKEAEVANIEAADVNRKRSALAILKATVEVCESLEHAEPVFLSHANIDKFIPVSHFQESETEQIFIF